MYIPKDSHIASLSTQYSSLFDTSYLSHDFLNAFFVQ